ncbi:MAG: hypothetical protein LBH90_02645 [Tannerella sp.]|jgi:hypothetical protein|nr:hypothetical protein [Tannerella sp.]
MRLFDRTNQSFRERIEIEEENAAMISRIIKEAVNSGFIKGFNPDSTICRVKFSTGLTQYSDFV